MNRRRQLAALAALAALGTATACARAAAPQPARQPGPALLTLSGAVERTNRGALDPALDQLMVKHQVSFGKARTLDTAALAAMPAVTIRPTLEYDRKPHTLAGPLLADVLQAAGAPQQPSTTLLLRAIDGYAVALPLMQARRQRFIVATHLDGRPLPLGGLGPLWAVYDADRVPEMAARPVEERFAQCPWGLYHIEVRSD
ncbi:molybdopterin-dependent oxidoreductase [Caldimonas tepidiphila]|uniref:molybdopterin-dependent oxidoreductase n=1 Tax=Caldimonas tepidiphila TaxID=2315841 RepID=UPI000E5AB479|nr:molybdopterin-dependent oxidoreductase [Caldimonas tepidiphila]